jgi:integrase
MENIEQALKYIYEFCRANSKSDKTHPRLNDAQSEQKGESLENENILELHDDYVRSLIARDLSPSYIELQRATRKYIISSELTRDDLNQPELKEKFAASLPPRLARISKRNYIANFIQFANWCANSHYTDRRHRHERQRYRPKTRDLPSAAETRLIFEALRRRYEDTKTDCYRRTRWQDELIVRVLYETGARISEALNILIQDVRQLRDVDYIVLRGSKTFAAERAVEISHELAEDITDFRRTWGKQLGLLFTSRSGHPIGRSGFTNWLTRFCVGLNISCHVTPHTFRYAWILGQIIEGKSALEVMTRAGHEKVDMTVYYFNQVRRLYPTVPISGDVALLERQMQTNKTIYGDKERGDR